MVKGFDRARLLYRNPFFVKYLLMLYLERNTKMKKNETKKPQKDVIARRKSCKADGTGLSHYILMDKKNKKNK